jgi:hypothetical protein
MGVKRYFESVVKIQFQVAAGATAFVPHWRDKGVMSPSGGGWERILGGGFIKIVNICY